MKKTIAHGALALTLLLLAPVIALAAGNTHIYISVDGTKQGRFKGEVARAGVSGITVLRFQYMVSSPRDPQSGLPTGKRQHSPVTITKQIDASTPQFFSALTSNEGLKSVVIEFTRPGPNGQERVYYTVKLTNANISRIYHYTGVSPAAGQPPENDDLEDISLTFQKIEITYTDGGITAADDWTR